MKISSIASKNFRTLENFSLTFQSNYCAISGKNNAGKSAVVKLIQHFLSDTDDRYFPWSNAGISFNGDVTQWANKDSMQVSIEVEVDKKDDSEVFFFVETFLGKSTHKDKISVKLTHTFSKDGSKKIEATVDEDALDDQTSSEILKKFRSSSTLLVHNSTSARRNIYYHGESYTEILEANFSFEDRKKITEAEKGLQTKVKKAAKQHKEELEKLLGKLSDSYKVELSTIDRIGSSRVPLEIKLTDKSVEVPLNDWGAGTQNRTRVLISVLDAIRLRSTANEKDRLTPIFLVEEPECFLHPSAQAEFGKVLNGLAEELKIQIIATTHSPYMLNQVDPSANILLERRSSRNQLKETQVTDTSGNSWMIPFAENLGIIPEEFGVWKNVFGVQSNKVILVEGDIDVAYFNFIKLQYEKIYNIPHDVEIVPYGGKDALKNTSILQFLIKKFGKVYITFDLDAESEVKSSLQRIGLIEKQDYCAIGASGPGLDCIEGLLPSSLRSKVYSQHPDEVAALGSQDTKARNKAKSHIKNKMLEEFKHHPLNDGDLIGFKKLFSCIATSFSKC